MQERHTRKYRWWQRGIATAFVSAIAFGGLATVPAEATGTSANNRITEYINLFKGKNSSNGADFTIEDLQKEDIQALGVYMSNFYVPYKTEVGLEEVNSEAGKKTRQEMDAVLKSSGMSNDDVRKVLVEYIMQQSRETMTKDLQWYISDKSPSEVSGADLHLDNNTRNTIYNLHKNTSGMYMLGYGVYDKCNDINSNGSVKDCYQRVWDTNKDKDKWGLTDPGTGPQMVIEQGKRYAYLATSDKKIAFSTDLYMEDSTPSMVALANAAKMSDPANGYGTSFFDFSKEEIEKDKALESGNLLKSSIMDTPLQIDGFGNLVAMGANHQYVVMPGAMNPYTWQGVKSDGSVDAGITRGSVLNVMNAPMLTFASQGGLVYQCSGLTGDSISDSKCRVNSNSVNDHKDGMMTKNANNHDYPDDDNTTDHKQDQIAPKARIFRGTNETRMLNTESNFWEFNQDKTIEGKALTETILEFLRVYKGKEVSAAINHNKVNGDLTKYEKTLEWFYLPYFGNITLGFPSSDVRVYAKGAGFDMLGMKSDADADEATAVSALGEDGKTTEKIKIEDGKSDFKNQFKGDKLKDTLFKSSLSNSDLQTLFFTYLMAMNWDSASNPDGGTAMKTLNGALGYRIDKEGLPTITAGPLEISDETINSLQENGANQRDEDIRNWVWYLLNPSEGFEYGSSLITNKSTAFMMDIHSDIVGSGDMENVAGSTKYVGWSGYLALPELTDLPWTDAALKWYSANWMYVALIMIIILGFYALTGVITLQKAIGSMVLFALLAMLPAQLINFTVNKANMVTNAIYGDKFTYWALLQNQSYSQAIEKAAGEDNYNDYLRQQMAANSAINITGIDGGKGLNSNGSSSVVVKWQAPKKMATLMADANASLMGDASNDNNSVLLGTGFGGLSEVYSGESYLQNDSVYMYRSYIDLANFSRFIYKGFEDGKQSTDKKIDTSSWPKTLRTAWNKRNTFSKQVEDGYNVANDSVTGKGSNSVEKSARVMKPLSSRIVADTFGQAGKVESMSQKTYLGIDTRAFNFSLKPFNNGEDLMEGIKKSTENLASSKKQAQGDSTYADFDPKMGNKKYNNKDYAGLASYALHSESPFYYFAWNLYDQGLTTQVGDTSGYKQLLLGKKDGREYFYNVNGNNEMKDYLDMRSLFTYTIPYMKAGNNVVRQFDNVYGLKYEKGVPTIEGYENNPEIKNNPEMRQKYWKNLNIARLYSIYSPWVDLMYDTNYSKPQTLDIQGEKVSISDPIDPSTYPTNRPMVFSKSEQKDWGLKDNQLTEVEKKIQKVQESTQKDMYGLLNALNYDDNVLVTASAINSTFNFNKEFSESNLIGKNVQMYPQAYELKNFSYDASLRLILSNTTGESISNTSANDFYTGIVQKSSMFTAALLLVNDVVSSYVIPVAKIFGIVAIGLMSILMLVATCIRIEDELLKNILRSLVFPLLGLVGIFIGMAWVVSLFMSNGNTAVTGYDGVAVSMGDPVMVLIAMLAIHAVVIILLFLLFKFMIGNIMRYAKSIGSSMWAVSKGSASAVKTVFQGQGLRAAQSAAGVSTQDSLGSSGLLANNDNVSGGHKGNGKISKRASETLNSITTDNVKKPVMDEQPNAPKKTKSAVDETGFEEVNTPKTSFVDPFKTERERREDAPNTENSHRTSEEEHREDTKPQTEDKEPEPKQDNRRERFNFDNL